MIRIRKPQDPNQYYISKEDLLKAVLEYQEKVKVAQREGKQLPQQPNIIGKYIIDLCSRLRTRYNFSQYSYGDLMVGEAIEHCVKAVTKFDYEKMSQSKSMNIFNYFTTVAWRAFQFRIIEERKQNAIKHKHYQHTYRLSELDGEQILDASNNEYSNRVIDEFEAKHLNKNVLTNKDEESIIDKKVEENKNVQRKKFRTNPTSSSKPRRGRPKRK